MLNTENKNDLSRLQPDHDQTLRLRRAISYRRTPATLILRTLVGRIHRRPSRV